MINFNNRLFLIRHGETEMNKAGIIQGSVDSPLTDLGLSQAKEASQKAKDFNIDILISSDLGRTKKTAGIISQEIGIPLLRTDPALRERNFGELEGKTFDASGKIYPQFVNPDGMFILYREFKEAESVDDFYNRIVDGVKGIMKEYSNKNVMLVGHGGTLRMMYAYINNIDPHDVWEVYRPGNCEVLNY